MASRNPTTLMSMSSQDDVFDFLFKIVLIGDCGTGKTCITQRFKAGKLSGEFISMDHCNCPLSLGFQAIS